MPTSTTSVLSDASAVASQPQTKPKANNTASSGSVALLENLKLPYQVDHQVELLHLRAEAEALLQQLQILKQQRLVSVDQSVSDR